MPQRPLATDMTGYMNEAFERIRALERLGTQQEPIVAVRSLLVGGYTWQSAVSLTVSTGQRFYTERAGTISFCRAERPSGDGASTATLDVLVNGASIYGSNPKPTVPATTFLGDEAPPDVTRFAKGDYFQIEIEATGGGTGPLRLTIALLEP